MTDEITNTEQSRVAADCPNERRVMCDQTAKCTLCAKDESPGFYRGCMCKDLGSQNGWDCDGNGNLTRCET
jgi:hypothetical protein